ncbi:MAG: mechanosensitive ion channel family protein [Burkholderiaceae bacterium]|nr:mechanosensitive ion channel family protein [Burkholderiaceae bacterium]MCD8516213.1 mechanosensitive ion channel family protein [Burkholderiaceae bacterium]MCD8566220.1 mechanosensitive ion channel family protein [Burkholderiaceae bacterium]
MSGNLIVRTPSWPTVTWLKCLVAMLLLTMQSMTLADTRSWAGDWDTRWPGGGARVSMTQQGDQVKGVYPLYNGTIEGTVNGRVLQGRWWQDGSSGELIAVQSADGRSFTAKLDGGQWWTGVRIVDDGISLGFEVKQSSPADALYYFLLIMNSVGYGAMELKSEASGLIDWPSLGKLDISHLAYTELLYELLDRLTIRLRSIKRTVDGSRYEATLGQAGTDYSFVLGFVQRDGLWYIEPPNMASLQAALETTKANRGAEPNRKIAEVSSPRASLKTLLTRFDETNPDSISLVINTLNLSQMPELSKRYESKRLAGYLKRSIERIGTPIWQEIPDDPNRSSPYVLFDHPLGQIKLEPTETDNGIVWQFSPESLRNIRELYTAIDDLPTSASTLGTPATRSLYFTVRDFFGNQSDLWTERLGPMALWQWLGLLLALIVAYALGHVATLLIGAPLLMLFQKNLNDHPFYQTSLIWALRLLLIGVTLRLVDEPLGLPDMVEVTVLTTSFSFIVISVSAVILILINLVADHVSRLHLLAGNNITLVSLIAGILRVVIILAAILVLADLLEIPYQGVIAGLGIGGLAVALAAQSTLQNFISGITLYFDKPIAIGDYCRFGNREGTVEFIGMRSTRIRTLDRTLVTVPNSEFSNLQIENYAKRDRIFLNTTIQVRYETTPDQMRYLLAEIRKLLIAHPKVAPDPLRVRFKGFGEHSLDISIFAYVLTDNRSEFLAIQEDLFLRMMEIVDQAGAQFAFPSMVYYEAQDTPHDPAKVKAAESAVSKWRQDNNLPFPDFSWQEKAEISSTLDYPPAGSAVAQKLDAQTIVDANKPDKSPAPDFPEPNSPQK